jgi:hypothetical protein
MVREDPVAEVGQADGFIGDVAALAAPVHGQSAGLGVRNDVVVDAGGYPDRTGRLERSDALVVEDGLGAGFGGC